MAQSFVASLAFSRTHLDKCLPTKMDKWLPTKMDKWLPAKMDKWLPTKMDKLLPAKMDKGLPANMSWLPAKMNRRTAIPTLQLPASSHQRLGLAAQEESLCDHSWVKRPKKTGDHGGIFPYGVSVAKPSDFASPEFNRYRKIEKTSHTGLDGGWISYETLEIAVNSSLGFGGVKS